MSPSDARARLRALEKVGHIYSHALGVVRSCRTAVHAFKTVAERGPWVAELSAAHARHEAGDGQGARLAYARAAEAGYEVNGACSPSLSRG